jgi:hypothetical protein
MPLPEDFVEAQHFLIEQFEVLPQPDICPYVLADRLSYPSIANDASTKDGTRPPSEESKQYITTTYDVL